MPSIKIQDMGVKFSYAPPNNGDVFWALRNINLSLNQGDKLAVIGVNGSGKSTFLKVLSDSQSITEGKVHKKGETLSLLDRGKGLIYDLSVRENIYLAGLAFKLKGTELKNYCENVLRIANLHNRQKSAVNTLSTGMVGKLNLALNSQVIRDINILDEWIGTLDMSQIEQGGFLNQLVEHSGIVIIASHNQKLVKELCNKVLLLHNGEQKYFGQEFNKAYSILNDLQRTQSHPSTERRSSSAETYLINPYSSGRYLLDKILNSVSPEQSTLRMMPRGSALQSTPNNAKVILCYRDPLERILRGFERRSQQGMPFYFNPWTELEIEIFGIYSTIEDIDESILDDLQSQKIPRAFHELSAINSIYNSHRGFFGSLKELKSQLSRILGIVCIDNPRTALEQIDTYTGTPEKMLTVFQSMNFEHKEYFSSSLRDRLSARTINAFEEYLSQEYLYLESVKTMIKSEA